MNNFEKKKSVSLLFELTVGFVHENNISEVLLYINIYFSAELKDCSIQNFYTYII